VSLIVFAKEKILVFDQLSIDSVSKNLTVLAYIYT